jgi:uncharacterized protein YwgA
MNRANRRRHLQSILRAIQATSGKSMSGKTFATRRRIQGAIYLHKAVSKDPLMVDYSFSEYFHGPYDSVLAKDVEALRAMYGSAS